MSSPSRKTVVIAGAAAISASLIGFAALQDTAKPPAQTHAVALTAGDADIFLPEPVTLVPSVVEGLPPFLHVVEGTEQWYLPSDTPGTLNVLFGTDTHAAIGSFTNDDFVETSASSTVGATLPDKGAEFDYLNFGGGFANEYASIPDPGSDNTVTDTVITPFGNYTIPLGTTPPLEDAAAVAAAAPADAFSGLEASIQFNTSAAETAFGLAQTAFADGEYPLALSQALDGFNNLTVGVTNDLLVNGYIALTGGDEYAEFFFLNPGQPADLALAFESAQTFLSQAQGLVTDALGDFGAGNTVSALTDLAGIGTDSTYATDAIILGLFDVLTGAMPSA